MALLSFRDTVRLKTPRWLRGGVGEKILYAIAIQIDALVDALVAAVRARFPNLYTPESLPIIGRDRRIRRGRIETDAVYASRLVRWLDDHRLRGGPYALLAQLFAHYSPESFAIDLIYYSGRRFQMDSSGVIVRSDIEWAPDTDAEKWAPWWLFYAWPTAVSTDGTWGDAGTWSDGSVWDYDLTVNAVADIRLVPREWNAAHPLGTIVLLNPASELWDFPVGTWGDAGTWGGADTIFIGVD